MKIVDFSYEIVNTKLTKPYKLSYKKLISYESVVTEIVLQNGDKLYGEVTPLIGYTEETLDSIENDIKMLKDLLINQEISDAISSLIKIEDINKSFTLSSILPPLEEYILSSSLSLSLRKEDMIFALDCTDDSIKEIEQKIINILEEGYSTVKIKVGKNISQELELVEKLSQINLENLKIRFDANCGYNYAESYLFLDTISNKISKNVEYLEQPMCRKSWDKMKLLNEQKFLVPIMIDESIYSIEDVKKAHEIGSKYIKLKLCKFGSYYKLQKALDFAKSLGLNVIFGNGVATDISNYYEGLFFERNRNKIYGATEGVGFLKLQSKLIYNIKVKES